jgi:hypothetical protein
MQIIKMLDIYNLELNSKYRFVCSDTVSKSFNTLSSASFNEFEYVNIAWARSIQRKDSAGGVAD